MSNTCRNKKIIFALLYVKTDKSIIKVLNNAILFCVSLLRSSTEMVVRYSSYLAMRCVIELFENNQIQKHANLTRYITLIQGMAKLWIHLFTGMRGNEVNQLSYDCYQTVQIHEHLVHVITGYTSKLHRGGNKSTYWISFEDIQFGVRTAQSIGEIYTLPNPHYDLSNPAEYPLFPTRDSKKHRNKNNRNIKNETNFISNFEGAPT